MLAWTVSHAQFMAMKSTNPHIKVNLEWRQGTGVRSTESNSSFLGWFVVDVRHMEPSLAAASNARWTWETVRGKGPGFGSEVRVCTSVVQIQTELPEAARTPAARPRSAPESSSSPSPGSSTDSDSPGGEIDVRRELQRVRFAQSETGGAPGMVSDEDDAIAIGTGAGTDLFELRVELDACERFHFLPAVSSIASRRSQEGGSRRFWFSYRAFGVLVQSDAFEDPKTAGFRPMRDSFSLRASRVDLVRFLRAQPPLPIHACSSGVVLATCFLPLAQLLPGARVLAPPDPSDDPLFASQAPAISSGGIRRERVVGWPAALEGDSLPGWSVLTTLEGDFPLVPPGASAAEATAIGASLRGKITIAVPSDLERETPVAAAPPPAPVAPELAPAVEPDTALQHRLVQAAEAAEAIVQELVHMKQRTVEPVTTVTTVTEPVSSSRHEQPKEQDHADEESDEAEALEEATSPVEPRRHVADSATAAPPEQHQHRLRQGEEPEEEEDRQVPLREVSRRASAPIPEIPETELAYFMDDSVRHFRLSVEVRSIRDVSRAGVMFCRCSVPELGVGAEHELRTRPPVMIPRHSERLLPSPFKAFEFAARGADLMRWCARRPLEVETWRHDRFESDRRTGLCRVQLRSLLHGQAHYRCPHTGATFVSQGMLRQHIAQLRAKPSDEQRDWSAPAVVVRAYDAYHKAFAFASDDGAPSASSRVVESCSVRVVVFLEDLGELSPEAVEAGEGVGACVRGRSGSPVRVLPLAESVASVQAADEGLDERGGPKHTATPPPLASSAASPAAVPGEGLLPVQARIDAAVAEAVAQAQEDFARWRASEEVAFAASLRKREAEMRQKLEEEQRQRDDERRAELASARSHIDSLERQLKKAILSAEKRGRDAVVARQDAERERDLARKDAEAEVRRVREGAESYVQVERRKAADALAQLEESREALEAEQERRMAVEARLTAAVERMQAGPGAELQREAAEARAAGEALRAQLETARAEAVRSQVSAQEGRAQVLRLAKEVQRLREREREAAARELQQLRVEFLAREQRFALDGDLRRLRSIRERVAALREVDDVGEEECKEPEPPAEPPVKDKSRLQVERDQLLADGYPLDHPLVRNLDVLLEVS
jgi:hypothetical protein